MQREAMRNRIHLDKVLMTSVPECQQHSTDYYWMPACLQTPTTSHQGVMERVLTTTPDSPPSAIKVQTRLNSFKVWLMMRLRHLTIPVRTTHLMIPYVCCMGLNKFTCVLICSYVLYIVLNRWWSKKRIPKTILGHPPPIPKIIPHQTPRHPGQNKRIVK